MLFGVTFAFALSFRFGAALYALAADRLDDIVKVFLAVVVSDLFTSFDISPRPNPHAASGNNRFGVWRTRVIDVARNVAARTAVDRPFAVNAEEILAVTLFDFLVRNVWPGVFDDSFAFGNWLQRKEAEAGSSSLDGIVAISWFHSCLQKGSR
jgi:hypothetical protein